MTDFSREVDATVAGALNPGERVIWKGHCLSRLGKQQKAQRTSLWTVVFVIPFTGIGLLFLIDALRNGPSGGLIVSPIFIAIGVLTAFSLFSEQRADGAMYCRKQTVYVMTDQRAFVLKQCRTKVPMRSVDWRFVDDVRAESVGPDGRGTVRFLRWDPLARRWDTPLQVYKVGAAFRVAEWGQGAMERANE